MLNPWKAIVQVVWEPRKTFEDLAKYERTPIWQPILVVLLGNLLLVWLLLEDILAMVRREMLMLNESAEVIEMTLEVTKYGVLAGSLFSVLPLLLIPLILVFVGQFTGAEATYRQLVTVIGYAYALPVLLGGFLHASLTKLSGDSLTDSNLSLAVFVTEDSSPFIYNLAQAFDPFNIWILVLVVVGYSVFNRIDVRRSSKFIGGLWLVSVVLSALLAGLFLA